jgi:hypothetical protein
MKRITISDYYHARDLYLNHGEDDDVFNIICDIFQTLHWESPKECKNIILKKIRKTNDDKK